MVGQLSTLTSVLHSRLAYERVAFAGERHG